MKPAGSLPPWKFCSCSEHGYCVCRDSSWFPDVVCDISCFLVLKGEFPGSTSRSLGSLVMAVTLSFPSMTYMIFLSTPISLHLSP